MNSQNVTAGKPAISGAIYRAPLGSTLPTTADGELDEAFKQLGYVSDSGLVNSNTPETSDVKAWGGDIVLSTQSQKKDTFKFQLIEALNVEVLKTIYGDDNVSGTLDTGITVKANATEAQESVYAVDMIMKGGVLKRIVIPSAKLTSLGDVSYTDSAQVGYDVTITAYPDSNGQTHYEYMKKKATA